jgi:hypothetical protein
MARAQGTGFAQNVDDIVRGWQEVHKTWKQAYPDHWM